MKRRSQFRRGWRQRHIKKILALAEEARHAARPEQTVAQHFAKFFSSHEHRELAKERSVKRTDQ